MPVVVFCHGIPGSPSDADLLRTANPNTEIVTLDLLGIGPDGLDAAIKDIDPDQDIHLVGFSIGAMVAVKTAATNPLRVSRLTLVSPAAPLSLGDFLPEMAGRLVFQFAINGPRRLAALTWAQGIIARLSPRFLIKMLFLESGPVEKSLSQNPQFQNILREGFLNSFARRPKTYRAFLSAYVSDWGSLISSVKCPVDIWHGTHDTWSPPAMADAMHRTFKTEVTRHRVPQAGHYSTMKHVTLPQT